MVTSSSSDGEPDAPETLTKACLIAPSFSPSPATKGLQQQHSPDSTSSKISATHKSFVSIDNAVRAAYKQVRQERDLKRKCLVRDVVGASRDRVIDELLRKGRGLEATPTHSIVIVGNNTCQETRPSNPSNGTTKRRRTIFDQIEMAVNPHKSRRIGSIPITSPTHVAETSCNGRGENGDNGSTSNRDYSARQTSTKTLIFPRLPSNNCPMHHIIFAPSLLKCRDDDDGASTDNATTATDAIDSRNAYAPPPNLSKSGKKDYTVTIKQSSSSSNNGGGGGARTITTTHQPLLIEGAHAFRPKSSSMIFLKSTIAVDDEPILNHVPYLGDGVNEDIFSELYDTKKREQLYEFGPPYQEKETKDTIDAVLKLMAVQKPHLFEDVEIFHETSSGNVSDDDNNNVYDSAEKKAPITPRQLHVKMLKRIHLLLTELANIDLERVHERHSACFVLRDGDKRSRASSFGEDHHRSRASSFGEDHHRSRASSFSEDHHRYRASSFSEDHHSKAGGLPSSPKRNFVARGTAGATIPYAVLMDSYRSLFCRRCFTYDCAVHGNLPQASLDLLGELAVQKEKDGHWKEIDKDISDVPNDSVSQGAAEEPITTSELSVCRRAFLTFQGLLRPDDKVKLTSKVELSPTQKSICRRAHLIFQGDIGKMAETIGIPPETVDAFVKAEEIVLPPRKFVFTEPARKKHGSRNRNCAYTSMKNYNQNWLRHIQSKIIHPEFLPCDHDEPCNEETCSCIRNGFFCTKHCGYGSKSPNFFRGCECKAGQCRLYSCPCYAANRECDPDLCRACGACIDPPDAPAGDGQRCRNDNISMGRRAHTLVAKSIIEEAGWGLFTKHALKKGDFVLEYVGERISQEEAERRGVVYDKLNMSYLFNLNSDTVIDATRKGNKARFINHSSTPNIEPKVVHVNGDSRIGFFAKHDIDPQSELFFDYRYDDKIDNELIFKPDHSIHFDWMKKNVDGRKKN